MKRGKVVRDYGGISAADRRADRRRRLVAAGRKIWGDSGITGVTVRGVCNAAGLIPRYFYEQFPNRDALLFAVHDDVRDELLAALVAAGIGDPGSLTDKLRSALTAFLEVIAADPDVHRITTSDLSSVPGLTEHRGRILDMITELVVGHSGDVLENPTAESAKLRRGAVFLVGGTNQIIESWLDDPRESIAELATICANLCVAVVDSLTRPHDQPIG